MTIRAGNVIDAARDRHAAFDPKHHPNKGALRILSQYAKRLHGKISQIDPNLVTVVDTVALPLADFTVGIPLTSTRLVLDVQAHFANQTTVPKDPYQVRLIDFQQRNAPNAPRAAAWQVGATLYLRPISTIWSNFDSVEITTSTVPADLADLDDTVALPDVAELACVERVALFFANREVQERPDSKINISIFAQTLGSAETDLLTDIGNNVGARSFFTEDVYRP